MNKVGLVIVSFLLLPTLLPAQPKSCDVPVSTSISDLLPLIAECVEPLPKGTIEPLFADLGNYSCPVAFQGPDAPKAQRYFDQGLTLWYGFNMPEALLSFSQAAQYDKDAPMPYWGIALAAGPDVNHERPQCFCLKLCYLASQTAVHKAKTRALKAGASDDDVRQVTTALRAHQVGPAKAILDKHPPAGRVQQALRELGYAVALAQRFTCEAKACPKCGLDATYGYEEAQITAFTRAMQLNHQLFPTDPDLAVVYAASLMQTHPWKWWTRDKKPAPEIAIVIKVLQGVLAAHVDHPGANHFFVHAVEDGPISWVENALPSAQRLPRLVPGSGHLQHMPSHIYRNLGQYDLATEANERAVAADRRYIKEIAKHHPVARYPLHYLGHNLHFLATTQIAQGQRAQAQATAQQLLDLVVEYAGSYDARHNKDLVRNEAARFLAVPLATSLQSEFAEWKETHDRVTAAHKKVSGVLKQVGTEDADLPFTRAMLAYGNALHSLEHQDWKAAIQHIRDYKELTRRRESQLQTNAATALYKIANNVLIARAAQVADQNRDGKATLVTLLGILESPFAKDTPPDGLALKAWQAAVEHQDQLNYNDPPEWYYPVRQSLGAAYFLRARFAEAEDTFRQDLKINPGNPRSLFGLIESGRKQGKSMEPDIERQFKRQWGNNPLPSFKAM